MTGGKLTLRQLLWGAEVSAGVASCVALASRNASSLTMIAGAPVQAIMNEAATALSEALDIGLGDILARAWIDSRKLLDAADPDMHGPDETILVPLAEHTIHSEHKPTLEFTIDGKAVCSLEFVVELALELQEVVLRIRAGRIRSVVGGSCHAKAALCCDGVELVTHETRDIALPLSVELAEGILIRSHRRPAATLDAQSSRSPA